MSNLLLPRRSPSVSRNRSGLPNVSKQVCILVLKPPLLCLGAWLSCRSLEQTFGTEEIDMRQEYLYNKCNCNN